MHRELVRGSGNSAQSYAKIMGIDIGIFEQVSICDDAHDTAGFIYHRHTAYFVGRHQGQDLLDVLLLRARKQIPRHAVSNQDFRRITILGKYSDAEVAIRDNASKLSVLKILNHQ
jgi:hypothetical protein